MEFIETMLCHNGRIELLEFHLDRLRWGLYQNDMSLVEDIIAQASQTILFYLPRDSKKYKVRYLFNIDEAGNHSEKIELIKISSPSRKTCSIGIYTEQFKKIEAPWNAKTTERSIYQSAMKWSQANNLEDALILNVKGHVIETSIFNIFLLKNNILLTPPLSDLPVKGVFRTWMIQNSIFPIIEQSLSTKDILSADLILLTNAIQGVRVGKITQI